MRISASLHFTSLYEDVDITQTTAIWYSATIPSVAGLRSMLNVKPPTCKTSAHALTSEGDMTMNKTNVTTLSAGVMFAVGTFASVAWAGDVKGKVTAQGVRSAEGIAVYIDSVPG